MEQERSKLSEGLRSGQKIMVFVQDWKERGKKGEKES